jgi:hypothetical protein
MAPNSLVGTISAPIKSSSTQTECARKVCWVHMAASLRRISPMKVIRHIPTWPPSQNIMGMKWHTMGWFSQSERLAGAMFSSSCAPNQRPLRRLDPLMALGLRP